MTSCHCPSFIIRIYKRSPALTLLELYYYIEEKDWEQSKVKNLKTLRVNFPDFLKISAPHVLYSYQLKFLAIIIMLYPFSDFSQI